jgi:hypothetical protein
MKAQAQPWTRRAGRLWTRGVWPVLAGAVTAVGVVSAVIAFGLLTFLAVYAGLWLFAFVTVWGLTLEADIARSSVLRMSHCATLVVLVLAGLCELHAQYGLLTAVVAGLTSPVSIALIARLRPSRARRTAGTATPGVLMDSVMLDRRFHDIVSRLRESGDFPED